MMFDNFTPEAPKAVVAAEGLARRYLHQEIDGLDLLMGAIGVDGEDGDALRVAVGADRAAVTASLSELVKTGTEAKEGRISLARDAKFILEAASLEAKGFHHDHVTTGHIILASLRAFKGPFLALLEEHGYTVLSVGRFLVGDPSTAGFTVKTTEGTGRFFKKRG